MIADIGGGPPLSWSALALRSRARHDITIRPGRATSGLRSLSGATAAITADGFAVEVLRGESSQWVWLTEDELPHVLALDVSQGGGRITGLIRNGFRRAWTDVWLFSPGRQPARLADLPAAGAQLVDMELPPEGVEPLERKVTTSLPLDRARLLEAAIEQVVRPLLARDVPVVLAWTDAPLHPAGIDGRPASRGATLLIVAGRDAA